MSASNMPIDPDGPADAQGIDIVVDTNIWLDILVFDDPTSRRLAALLRPPSPVPHLSSVRPVSSDEMRAELADVVARPQFQLDPTARAALLARYDAAVVCAPAAPDCRLPCRDPDDRKFLDLAVGRRTSWLLSRDRALLAARKVAWNRFALRIGQTTDFYDWLDAGMHP